MASATRSPVRASGLQPWQLSRLQQAASLGRRRVQVEKLCKEVQLPRGTVLEFLKTYQPPAEPDRASARELEVDVGRVTRSESDPWSDVAEVASEPAWAPRRQAQGQQGGQQSTPAWKRFSKPKSLGRQAEATLEMVYSRTQWPSDDVIDSMWDLHRMRRDKVIEWFKTKRLQDRERQPRQRAEQQTDNIEWFTPDDQ
ncbi:hypothetical protein N2152v2_009404 [Parachlorella kessleri]